MTNATHTWTILGITRFTPAPNAPSYISSVNWQLTTEVGDRVTARTDFTTFGPDNPGSVDFGNPELIALIRNPEIEAELEAKLGYAPGEPAPPEEPACALPEPEIQTTEIPLVEEAVSSTDTQAPEEPPVICAFEPAPKRRRARNKKGTYKSDDPATPENEAWTTQ